MSTLSGSMVAEVIALAVLSIGVAMVFGIGWSMIVLGVLLLIGAEIYGIPARSAGPSEEQR